MKGRENSASLRDDDLKNRRSISVSAWRRSLAPEVKAELRRLQVLDQSKNLRILLFLLIWGVAGLMAFQINALTIRLICYFFMGASIHALGILMHEGVHHTMFRNKTLNRWVSFASGLPALLSVSAYRIGHMPHHRYERDHEDPDELENFTTNPKVLTLLFCLTLLFGEIFGFYRIGPMNALRCKASERRDIFVEYTIIAFVFAMVLLTAPLEVFLHFWVFPVLFGRLLTNVRTLSEHILTQKNNPLTPTRTVTSNKFVSFFMCNLNFHVEHHLFPAIPYYNLPKVHRLLKTEFNRFRVPIYRTYSEFLWELGAFIVKAWGPHGNNLELCLPPKSSRLS